MSQNSNRSSNFACNWMKHALIPNAWSVSHCFCSSLLRADSSSSERLFPFFISSKLRCTTRMDSACCLSTAFSLAWCCFSCDSHCALSFLSSRDFSPMPFFSSENSVSVADRLVFSGLIWSRRSWRCCLIPSRSFPCSLDHRATSEAVMVMSISCFRCFAIAEGRSCDSHTSVIVSATRFKLSWTRAHASHGTNAVSNVCEATVLVSFAIALWESLELWGTNGEFWLEVRDNKPPYPGLIDFVRGLFAVLLPEVLISESLVLFNFLTVSKVWSWSSALIASNFWMVLPLDLFCRKRKFDKEIKNWPIYSCRFKSFIHVCFNPYPKSSKIHPWFCPILMDSVLHSIAQTRSVLEGLSTHWQMKVIKHYWYLFLPQYEVVGISYLAGPSCSKTSWQPDQWTFGSRPHDWLLGDGLGY